LKGCQPQSRRGYAGLVLLQEIHLNLLISFIFAVTISVYMTAALSPPRSEPANSQDFLPSATPLHQQTPSTQTKTTSKAAKSATLELFVTNLG
jgi:hypothetical protein